MRNNYIPEQDKPIYKFKLDVRAGGIDVTKITRYEFVRFDNSIWNPDKDFYRYRAISQWAYIKQVNLDRMFHNTVYSFNPDIKQIKKIMAATLKEKAIKLQKEYEKTLDIYNKFNSGG